MPEKPDPEWTIGIAELSPYKRVFLEFPEKFVTVWQVLGATWEGGVQSSAKIEYFKTRKEFGYEDIQSLDLRLVDLKKFMSLEIRYDQAIVVLTKLYRNYHNATEMLAEDYKTKVIAYRERYTEKESS